MTWRTILALGFTALATQAQNRFEVTSVKPAAASCADAGRKGGNGAAPVLSPARLELACRTVKSLLQLAYDLPIAGGPAWIDSERFDIEAKAEGAPGQSAMRGPMLQALLADRFQLRSHMETREVSILVLTVAKGGPKRLRPAQEGNCLVKERGSPRPPEGTHFCGLFYPSVNKDGSDVYGISMADLAHQFALLSNEDVVDRTGITGKFDFHVEAPQAETVAASGDSLIYAITDQIGLKLDAGKGPGKYVVVDDVKRPSGN